jgi:NADH-quinone oxidoreductase subunit E
LSLFWQVVLFLIVIAALGFAIGWLLRGARLPRERSVPRHSGGEAAVADERDRLQAELRAASDARAKLEASLAEAQGLADAGAERVRELEQSEASDRQRIARLEHDLVQAQRPDDDRGSDVERRPARLADPVARPADEVEGAPPQALGAPEGEPDDLKKISGIGPGIEKTLHGLGIFHFRQIAAFTPDNVAWIDQHLRFKGRIEREGWIEQAEKLAAGETIERV